MGGGSRRPVQVHNGHVRYLAPAVALLVAATGAACATLQARPAAPGPALETPAPPPHELRVPSDAEPARGTAPPAPRTPPRQAPAKPDKEKPDPEPPPIAPAGAPEPPIAPTKLQPTAKVAEVDKRVRLLLAQAAANLDRTDYRALNAERRSEYETARRFISQAEEALKVENVAYAEQLAGKAATLAERLVQRETLSSAAATPA